MHSHVLHHYHNNQVLVLMLFELLYKYTYLTVTLNSFEPPEVDHICWLSHVFIFGVDTLMHMQLVGMAWKSHICNTL